LLNFEDMNHDAEKLVQKSKINVFYEKCRNGLFKKGFPDEWVPPDLAYFKPTFIPKKDLYGKPSVITQNYSVRDTEPAKKLGMEEKYTPAYYFDPASRTFPATFPASVSAFHEKIIDLTKYGLAVALKITFMDNNMVIKNDGKNMRITIRSQIPEFQD